MGNVETFFKSQISTFDDAARLEHEMQADLDRIAQDAAAYGLKLGIMGFPFIQSRAMRQKIVERNGIRTTKQVNIVNGMGIETML